MEYRNLGESDLKLSVITFGAWAAGGWMWGGADRNNAVAAIRASYDAGVTSIDTAPAYGQGTSEEIVGEAIKGLPRENLQLLTKYGLRWDTTKGSFHFKSKDNDGHEINMHKYAGKESIIRECEDSLRRMRTDYIDLYQIHWPDITTPIAETMEAVSMLIQQGKVKYAGVCNYSVDQLREARKTMRVVANQVPYSMVKRDIEKDVVPYCVENNLAILAYSPLQRGLLTGKMKPGWVFAPGDHRAEIYYFTNDNINRANVFLDKLRPMATEKNATLSQLVLRWTLEQPGITIALVGARDVTQALENAKATEVQLSSKDIAFINGELKQLTLVRD